MLPRVCHELKVGVRHHGMSSIFAQLLYGPLFTAENVAVQLLPLYQDLTHIQQCNG